MASYVNNDWQQQSDEIIMECEKSLVPLVAHSGRIREQIILMMNQTKRLIHNSVNERGTANARIPDLQNYSSEIVRLLNSKAHLNKEEKDTLLAVNGYIHQIHETFTASEAVNSTPIAEALAFEKSVFDSIVRRYCEE